MRLRRLLAFVAMLWGLGEACAVAQETPPALPRVFPSETPLPPRGDEITLPPVIVRPKPDNRVLPPPDSTEGDLGVSSPAPSPAPAPAPAPYDLSLSYPSLSQQMFGEEDGTGLNSLTRNKKSLFDTSTHGTIIDRASLAEKQAVDMARAMQDEVGVLVQQTARGQASPFMRGLTGQQVLILVDGVRVNNSVFRAGPNQYFNLIDPGQVERIEVVRGPQSVLWGADAIGGAINIITRSAARDRGNYTGAGFTEYFSSADVGSYSRLNIEGSAGNTSMFAGGSYLNVNDLNRGGGMGVQPYTHYGQYDGDIKFNYTLGSDALLTVALQHFEQQDVPRSDRFAPFAYGPPAGTARPTYYDPQQRDLSYIRLQALADNPLFNAYSTTFSYARNKEGTREIRTTTRTDMAEFDVGTFGFDVNFAKELGWMGRLNYGVDYYHDDVDAYRYRLNPLTGSRTPDNPQFPNDSLYARSGVYLNWDVDVTERLNAVAGVRYENADASGTLNAVSGTRTPFERHYAGWVSSTGLIYEINSMVHLVGNVSEGYRAPNLDDLTADNPVLQNAQDLPSLDVRPERARTYEVGLKFDAPRLRMQVFEYWTDLQDAILRQAVNAKGVPVANVVGPYGTIIPGSSNFIRSNFDSCINGTELSAEYLLNQEWSVYGNFWYTFGQDLERNEPYSRIPPTQGILGLRWRDECRRKWFDVYTWMVASQDRYSSQNNIDARFPLGGNPAYATLNMRAGTTLGHRDRHRLSVSLENITNTGYHVLGSGVDGPGLNAILGYEWAH